MEPIENLEGKEFEGLCEDRFEHYKQRGVAHFKRYGVQVYGEGDPTSPSGIRWTPIRSFPDFEGALAPLGRQAIWDCKVVSAASFALSDYRWNGTDSKSKARQLRHMLDRSMFGALCGFLIRFNGRQLKTKADSPQTYLFPVHFDMPFWKGFMEGGNLSITRQHCEQIAIKVVWNKVGMDRTYRPDVLLALMELSDIQNAA